MNALILICALAVSAPDCQKKTSIHVFYAPEVQSGLAGCMTHGMLYASQSGLVDPGIYPKIVCIRSSRVLAKVNG